MSDNIDKIYEDLEKLLKNSKKELDRQILKIKQRLTEIQKQKMLEIRPKQLSKPDLKRLFAVCENYINEVEEYGIDEEDGHDYFFEEVMKAIYGEHVIDWLYKNYRR